MDGLFSPTQLSSTLWLLDYPCDYKLEEVLAHGLRDTGALMRFVQRINGLPHRPVTVSGGFGCTTFHAETAEGQQLFGRNYDFIDGAGLVLRCTPKYGYRSIAVTDLHAMLYTKELFRAALPDAKRLYLAPYCCMDGINEKGLAIAVLALKGPATRQHTGKTPLTTTSVIRAVLDTCADTEDAADLFRSFDLRSSLFYDYHFHVTDAAGGSTVIEYVNNRLNVLEDRPYAMNFYLSPDGNCRREMGRGREKKVRAALEETGGIMSEAEAMALLERCRLAYRHPVGYKIGTLWSAVYNCTERSVTVRSGRNADSTFRIGLQSCKKVD